MTAEATKPWYVGERAEKTVLLWLTEFNTADRPRRGENPKSDNKVKVESNFAVSKRGKHIESDFRVTLLSKEQIASFFVDVKGTTDTLEWMTADGIFNSNRYRPTFNSVSHLNAPVAVVVVNVKSTEAYFGWVVPPSGCASVVSDKPMSMRLATKTLLRQVFDEVLPEFSRNLPQF